jgi:Ni,Fe-hydrogenase III large subunit/NADH:ubiquinone oxidoreductase subunit C
MSDAIVPVADELLAPLRRAVRHLELAEKRDGTLIVRVPESELEYAVAALAESDSARFADLFGAHENGEVLARLVYGLDAVQRYLIVEAPVTDLGHPPISDGEPAAYVEECELFEQLGVRPSGERPLNRVLMPPHAEREFPLLDGGRRGAVPRELRAPHHVRGEAFEFPFGPVRVAGWESLYMGLVTTGEEVLDLYLFHWHKHRGIERRLHGLTPEQGLFLVERTEGLSAVAMACAYCRAVEAAGNSERLSLPVASTRTVALELERIYNHAQAIALLCQTTGLSVGQAQAEIALEQLLRVNLAGFGHRYLFGVVALGGARRAPDRDAVRELLPSAVGELERAVDALLKTNSHVDRLETCGILSEETARRLALVGPVARASGIDLDSRRDHPVPPDAWLAPSVPVRTNGDVLARMEVFVAEIKESQRLVLELLPEADSGTLEVAPSGGSGLGWAESPRGEALAFVTIDGQRRLARARLRPASVRNWRAFDDAARARNVFTDVPIIEASFWQTIAGFAR